MKLLLTFYLITFLLNANLLSQSRDYGEKNGYDWKDFYNKSEILFDKVDWSNKQEWIDNEARTRKLVYLIGIYDMATKMPTENYIKVTNEKGKDEYYDIGNPYPYLYGTSPEQMLSALDDFYSDYRNMNIKILEAIHVCQMEIKGERIEDIDWQTRYYRADIEGKRKMNAEKYHIKH